MYMKRYSFLLILLFVSTISLTAQVQDRFKTKQKGGTENQPDSTSEEDKDQPKANTSSRQQGSAINGEKFWDKVVIGGNASLSFGTYTFVYLAPAVGYKFTDNFIAGPGFIYQYARISGGRLSTGQTYPTYQNTVYGPKAFANYIVAERFYGGLQFEHLNHEVPFLATDPNTLVKFVDFHYVWTPVLFLEAGFVSPIGSKGYAQFGLRYNVLHGPESPYGAPLFPFIGFFF